VSNWMSLKACLKAVGNDPDAAARELLQLRYFWWRISCYDWREDSNDSTGIGHDGWKGWIETRDFYREKAKSDPTCPEWVGR
jgi:hypothetical protein